jgi:hypothetical protein
MKSRAKEVLRNEHGPGHVTPAGRSVFYDLFPQDKADELVMRATLLSGLERWLKKSKLTPAQAARALSITQARAQKPSEQSKSNTAHHLPLPETSSNIQLRSVVRTKSPINQGFFAFPDVQRCPEATLDSRF